jgi:sec-independent protein translocase protein TatC
MEDELKLPLEYHVTEVRDRALLIGATLVSLILAIIANYSTLTEYLSNLAYGRDLELYYGGIGDLITVAIQTTLFSSLVGLIPFFGYQIALYIYPALTTAEIGILRPLFVFSLINYFIGFVVCFYLVVPGVLDLGAAFGAMSTGTGLAWSAYLATIVFLFILTESVLSIPVLMLSLRLIWNVSCASMCGGWNYVLVMASIIAAIITPTTDPLTQLTFMFILLVVYIVGLGVVGF